MDPKDFYQLAVHLTQRGSPADLRTAIGRAYYACYNMAADLLRGWGIPLARNAAAHGEVLRYLANSGDRDLEQAEYILRAMRSRRNTADYDLSAAQAEDPRTAHDSVDGAKRLIEALDQCLDPTRSAKIIAAIAEYRRKIAPPPPGTP